MKTDLYGDSLRKFYKQFGMENEGPNENINVSALLPNNDFTGEIKLIENLYNDDVVIRKHNECKELMDDVANSLSDSGFMDEINESIEETKNSDQEHLINGIFWHYWASILHPKVGKELNLSIPFPGELPEIKKDLLKVQGSLIFRLYISLVYMKEGPIIDILTRAARNRSPISQKALKLLKCDYVRHIRNSLSHSTFESTSFGIYFIDDKRFKIVGSPEFLNSLITRVMLINFQCSTVLAYKKNN